MAVKELINRNRGVMVVCSLLAVAAAVWMGLRSMSGGPNLGATSAYYSDDDGKSWFSDQATLLTPFDRGGKEVYRAHVFRCKGKEFVGYLERSGDRVVSRDSAAPTAAQTAAGGKPVPVAAAGGAGAGVKKPGAKEWVSRGDFRRAATEMDVRCDGVAPTDVQYVMP